MPIRRRRRQRKRLRVEVARLLDCDSFKGLSERRVPSFDQARPIRLRRVHERGHVLTRVRFQHGPLLGDEWRSERLFVHRGGRSDVDRYRGDLENREAGRAQLLHGATDRPAVRRKRSRVARADWVGRVEQRHSADRPRRGLRVDELGQPWRRVDGSTRWCCCTSWLGHRFLAYRLSPPRSDDSGSRPSLPTRRARASRPPSAHGTRHGSVRMTTTPGRQGRLHLPRLRSGTTRQPRP